MKKMLVTYNAMEGIPVGRYEVGNLIVYSGDYGRSNYTGIPFVGENQVADAEKKMEEIVTDLAKDVAQIDSAYVYVGSAAMKGAFALIQDLNKAGKEVHMVACDCSLSEKEEMARQLSISRIDCECGGRDTCRRFVAELST